MEVLLKFEVMYRYLDDLNTLMLELPISGMAQVKCTILKAGRVGSLV